MKPTLVAMQQKLDLNWGFNFQISSNDKVVNTTCVIFKIFKYINYVSRALKYAKNVFSRLLDE